MPGRSNEAPCPESHAKAALASAAGFTIGAALPIGVVLAATPAHLIDFVSIASLAFLAGLGAPPAQGGDAGG